MKEAIGIIVIAMSMAGFAFAQVRTTPEVDPDPSQARWRWSQAPYSSLRAAAISRLDLIRTSWASGCRVS